MSQECGSDSDSCDNELFEILNREKGRHGIISEQMRIEELKVCLKKGDSVLAKDAKNNTLLHIAVEKEFIEVINFLLKDNIDLIYIKNARGENPIELANKLQRNNVLTVLGYWQAYERSTRTKSEIRIRPFLINRDNKTLQFVPGKTRADENSFFHAVFGEKNSNGIYETKLTHEMRQDCCKFLSQYESLKDESMPIELKEQLKKVFSLFLDIPDNLMDKLLNMKKIVAKTKEARTYCELRVKELKEIIALRFSHDELFKKDILEILFPSIESNIIDKENDIVNDKAKLINEIGNCLEDCALKLYGNLTRSDYKKMYNSETVVDNFINGREMFKNYVTAIASKRSIFFEEIPIFASLGNVTIESWYQDNGKFRSENFEPNRNLLGNFVPRITIWGTRKKAVIYYQDLQFYSMENITIGREEINDSSAMSTSATKQNLIINEGKNLDTKNNEENLLLSPLSTALKVDLDLKFKKFKDLLSVTSENHDLLNVNDLNDEVIPSPHVLVELSEKVYIEKEGKSNEEYEEELDLPPEWLLLTTATNNKNGYYGAAFWNSKFRQLVIAHKGIKSSKDMYRYMKKICLDEFGDEINSAVTFADRVIRIAQKVLGSDWQLAFTGHSLGGWLAQVTCFSAEFLRRDGDYFLMTDSSGVHAHCVAFDSPGCKTMLEKLKRDFSPRYGDAISLNKLDITTYLSAPNSVNTLNSHFGTLYRIFPDYSNLRVIDKYKTSYNKAENHPSQNIERITQVFVDRSRNTRKPKELKIVEVVDWPFSSHLKRGKEYKKILEWLDHINVYHLPFCMKQLATGEHTLLRYQTKEVMENCCSFSVFSSKELWLLKCLKIILEENIILPEIEEFMNKNQLSGLNNLLPKFSIAHEKEKLYCESKHSLETLINRIKRLMRRFSSTLTQAVMELPSAVESMYIMESKNFLETISRYDIHFKDGFELGEFINNDKRKIMCITTDDVDIDVVRTHNLCKQHMDLHERIIVLSWRQILSLSIYIGSHSKLLKVSNWCNLIIIIFPPQTELNEKTELVMKDLLTAINGENSKKLIFIISNKCALMRYITLTCSGENLELFHKDAEPVCFSNLAPVSLKKILDWPLLEVQGTLFTVGQLFDMKECCDGSLNHPQRILDSYLIKKIYFEEIPVVKVQNQMMDIYQDVYCVKIGINIPKENAVNFMCNPNRILENLSKHTVFLIDTDEEECPDMEKLLKLLNVSIKEQVEKIKDAWCSNLIVTVYHENARTKFKNLCRMFYEKRIYWLELKGDSVYWHSVYDRKFYIPRKLCNTFYLQPEMCEIFEKLDSDLFIFSNSSREHLTNFFKKEVDTERIFTYFNEKAASEKFDELKDLNTPVHLIRVEDDIQKLLWVRSCGSVDGIRKYVINSCDLIDENSFIQKRKKIVLFSGQPGVGKSTIAFTLTEYMKSSWVIYKELKTCRLIKHLPSKLDIDGVVSFLLSDLPMDTYSIASTLMKEFLTNRGSLEILLIFDGFEEITTEPKANISSESTSEESDQEKFIQLLEFLKDETLAYIWIISRTHLSTTIENKFSIFATDVKELNNVERKQFLSNIWTSRLCVELEKFCDREEKLLQQYIERLLLVDESILRKDISTFISAPLHMGMISVIAAPKAELFINKDDSHKSFSIESDTFMQINNIYVLYQRFVDAKYDTYIYESGTSSGFTVVPRTWILERLNTRHRSFGFQLLFPNNAEEVLGLELLISNDEFQSCEENVLNSLGIIQLNVNGEFKFSHKIFAEFFVADFFVIWIERGNHHQKYSPVEKLLVSKVLLLPDYKFIRLFMNNILAVRKPTEDALQSFAKSFWKTYQNKKAIFFNRFSQTFLHVVSYENCENIVELFLNIFDPLHFKDIIPECIDSFSLITSHDVFGHTPIHLAVELKCDYVIFRFIDFLSKLSEVSQKKIFLSILYGFCKDENDTHMIYFLKCVLKNGNESIKELASNITKKVSTIRQFVESVKQGDAIDVKKIMQECPDSLTQKCFLFMKDQNGKCALHLASECGFLEITQYLLDQNVPINIVDATGCTPLLHAAKKGHIHIVRLLLSCGANPFLNDAHNMSAVAWSAREGHLSVVQCLVEQGAGVNIADKNGIDAIQYAARYGHLEVVKLLTELGANINRQDDAGMTVLHWAAKTGHLHMVQHLVEWGADALTTDGTGFTPAQLAANNNNWDVAKWLLKRGFAQAGDLLHRAVCGNQWQVAEELISELSVGEASALFPPEGTWVNQMKEAKQWRLISRLVEKGADPGIDAHRWLREMIKEEEVGNEGKETKTLGDKED